MRPATAGDRERVAYRRSQICQPFREQSMTPVFKEQLAGADPTGGFGRQSRTFHARLTRDQIDRARRWLIVAGSLALVIGIVSIAVPVIASVTAAIFVGWVLVAS